MGPKSASKAELQADLEGLLKKVEGLEREREQSRRLEEQLKNSEERYRRLFEDANESIFVIEPETMRILDANKSAHTKLGYTREEMLRMTFRDFNTEAFEASQEESLSTLRETGEAFFEGFHVRKDGSNMPVEISSSLINLGGKTVLQCAVREVSQNGEGERLLEHDRRRLQTIFDTLPIGVYVKDMERRYLMVNRALAEIHDMDPEEFVGRHNQEISFFMPEKVAEIEEIELELMRTKKQHEIPEDLSILSDGRETWRNMIRTPILDENGRVSGILGVRIDIAERMALEGVLRRSQRLEAVGQLAGGVAHEFNNIFQVVMGFANLGLDGTPKDDNTHEFFQKIKESSDRAGELVGQLLGFGRRQAISPSAVDLNVVIDRFAQSIRPALGERIELMVEPGHDLQKCRADPAVIEQMLKNLCLNARDAMPRGGTLTLSTGNARLDEEFCAANPWATPGDYVRISVHDNGMGMTPEVLSHIFEPFFTTKGPQEGTGLGLSMVYGLVAQHNGLINPSSERARGTTIEIYLPWDGAAEPGREHGATVLVAEDDPTVQTLAAKILQEEGYRVLAASDGDAALEIFLAEAESIDLVLLDVVMPGLAAEEVFFKIREKRPEIPILLNSGYRLDPEKYGFIKRGGLQVLEKPYNPDLLRRAVKEALSGNEPGRPAKPS